MELLKIRIQSKEDAKNGIPAVELDRQQIATSKDITFSFIEGGAVSGNTTVMITLKDREGKMMMVGEITKGHFETAYHALQGAVERFGK